MMSNYNFTAEQLKAAKAAKSPEELIEKAKEHGIDITPEQAAAFLNPDTVKTEEIADEELDNVAGGVCHNGGREVVTTITSCLHDLSTVPESYYPNGKIHLRTCGNKMADRSGFAGAGKKDCEWLSYEKGLWLCNYPEHLKK